MNEPEPMLYHLLPPDMRGTTLYPLAEMAIRYPDVHAQAIGKYDDHPDRKGIPDRPVPPLNCTWRDVIQCCPVHPRLLYLAWKETGVRQDSKWFIEIPRSRVEMYPAAVFDRDAGGHEMYERVDWDSFAELSDVPEGTRRWYAKLANLGRRGAAFVGIPHIMIRGVIDITGLRVIDWADRDAD